MLNANASSLQILQREENWNQKYMGGQQINQQRRSFKDPVKWSWVAEVGLDVEAAVCMRGEVRPFFHITEELWRGCTAAGAGTKLKRTKKEGTCQCRASSERWKGKMMSSRKRKYDLPERIHADSQSLSDCVDSTIQNPLQRCVYPADSASGESSKCVSVEMSPLFKQSRYNEWSGEVEREMTLELGERAGGCLTEVILLAYHMW